MSAYLFRYAISLESPAIITGRGHRVYSASTLKYIPGSAIRGIVAGRLGDPDRKSEFERQRFNRLILSGQTRYRNAYPAIGGSGFLERERSIPIPLSFKKRKHEHPDSRPEVFDLLAADVEDILVDPDFEFAAIGTSEILPVAVKLGIRFHHSLGSGQGRPLKGEGAIFAYEYILGGQDFVGHVAIDADSIDEAREVAREISQILDTNLLLGRSKRAGYGGDARFMLKTEPEPRAVPDGIRGSVEHSGMFRVLLLSDFIGRDHDTGLVDPSSFQRYLEGRLGARLRESGCYVNTGYAGGYNRKSRSALPVTRTLSKGSVFLFEAQDGIALDKFLETENSGVGMRLSEGYGEIAFLSPPVTPEYEVVQVPDHAIATELPDKDDESERILDIMQQRILEDELDREIHRWIRELIYGKIYVSPSLLGRLRLALRNEPDIALNTFRLWLADTGDKSSNVKHGGALKTRALRQLQNCRLTEGSLSEWLLQVVNDSAYVLGRLNHKQLANDYYLISSNRAEQILRGMTDRIKCRVIDSALAEISRQVRLGERGGIDE